MGNYRRHIAGLFLMVFSYMQLVELHTLGHDDIDHVDCIVCHFSVEKSDLHYLGFSISAIPQAIGVPQFRIIPNFTATVYTDIMTVGLRNKAPPIG